MVEVRSWTRVGGRGVREERIEVGVVGRFLGVVGRKEKGWDGHGSGERS